MITDTIRDTDIARKVGTLVYPQVSHWKQESANGVRDKSEGLDRCTGHKPKNKGKRTYVTSGMSVPLATYVQAFEGKTSLGDGAVMKRERTGGKLTERERERDSASQGAGLISSTRSTSHLFGSICKVQMIASVPQQWALPR